MTDGSAFRKVDLDIAVLRECLRLDPDTGFLYWRERPFWHFDTPKHWRIFTTLFAGKQAFRCKGAHGYFVSNIHVEGVQYRLLAHRVVWALHHGAWPRCTIDHINLDKTDNRPINLREATHRENSVNKAAMRRNKTGFKGAIVAGTRFNAQIKIAGRSIHLGVFDTPEEANQAYLTAAKLEYGEFARGAR